MTAIELRTEINQLIIDQSDLSFLARIRDVLRKRSQQNTWREVLSARAEQAEEEIKAGQYISLEDLERELDEEFGA